MGGHWDPVMTPHPPPLTTATPKPSKQGAFPPPLAPHFGWGKRGYGCGPWFGGIHGDIMGGPWTSFLGRGAPTAPCAGWFQVLGGGGKVCFHPRVEALVTWAATPNREGLHTKLVEGPPQVVLVVRTTACPENSKNGTFQAEAPVDFITSRTMARRAGHLRSFFLRLNPHHTHAHTPRRLRGRSGTMRLGRSLQPCFCGRNRKTRVCPRAPAWRHCQPLTLSPSLRDVSIQLPA